MNDEQRARVAEIAKAHRPGMMYAMDDPASKESGLFVNALRDLIWLLALVEEEATMVWQPIETAPKDGTDVLLSNGHWVFEATSISDGRFLRTKDKNYTHPGNCKYWMPLPPAPTQPF